MEIVMRFLMCFLAFSAVFPGVAADRQTGEDELFAVAESAQGDIRNLACASARKYDSGFELSADKKEVIVDTVSTPGVNAGAAWTVRYNQKVAKPLVISAEAFPEKTDDGGDFQIYVDVTYDDDTCLWGQTAKFDRLISIGWHERSVLIQPTKPIKYIVVYTMLRKTSSRVRFRNVKVCELPGDAGNSFDSVRIDVKGVLKEPAFLIRDVAAHSGFSRITDSAKDIKLACSETRRGEAQFFDVKLTKKKRGDRAVTLVYAIPLPDGEITWHIHPRASMNLNGVKTEQRNTMTSLAGAGGLSHWPIGAVTVGGRGIALGLDTSAPAYFRTAVNPVLRILYIAFDIGLAEEAPSANFRFCRFPFDGAEGFRGAYETYMKLFPDAFKVRIKKQGIWMAFEKISKVEGWQDFGFAIKEHFNETAWDDANGITTFAYTEPGTWWMRIEAKKGQPKPSMEDCIAEAVRRAKKGDAAALAWWTSVCRTERGKPIGRLLDTPWCNGMVWSMNSAPGIRGDVTDFSRKIGEERFAERYTPGMQPPKGLDGEYVDSADLYVTAALDFDRSHFGAMKTPLCFSRDTCAPGVFKGMVSYEYVRNLAERLHPQGRLVMGNSTPIRWCWLAPYLDVMGFEIDWNKKAGWKPASDEQMLFHRALCGGKPFGYLMNTDLGTFSNAKMEKYMMRAVAYGLFPSVFSKTTSGYHYFQTPKLYNRDRALFKKFIPICKAISEAGWQPVNRLMSVEDPDIYLEQFGRADGKCYVTVFNNATEAKTVRLRLKKSAKVPSSELVARENVKWNGGEAAITIPAETLRVFAF